MPACRADETIMPCPLQAAALVLPHIQQDMTPHHHSYMERFRAYIYQDVLRALKVCAMSKKRRSQKSSLRMRYSPVSDLDRSVWHVVKQNGAPHGGWRRVSCGCCAKLGC